MKRDILYVDDELDNIVVFETAFEDEFNVITTQSGSEALTLLESRPVPVVVADQRMPQMTGVELCEILRHRFPETKRILLTGYTDQQAMVDAINRGQVFHYVKKPWERSFLFSVLVRALEAYDLEIANSALTNRLVTSERCALLGQVTARVAHEMGNQLCTLPLLEMIEDNYTDDEDLVKVARFARETHRRLEALIWEVKNFMRFEQKEFTRHPMPLVDVVQEFVSFLRFDERIPVQRVTVQVEALPIVSANKVKLQQILMNLIQNAVDAIRGDEDGRVTIVVDQSSRHAMLSVSDNGPGIPEEIRERIWEPFFSTKGEAGNGLGLDICRKLAESHGGTIECRSLPGEGTTFEVRLPRIERSTSRDERQTPAEALLPS